VSGATVAVEAVPGGVVAAVAGDVDLASVERLRAALAAAVADDSAVLDLSGVAYMDSVGVHLLFELARAAEDAGRRLTVVVPGDAPIARLLEVAQAERRMLVVPTREEAEAALAPPP
jgi:anti-anti-sigma factor